MTKETDGLKGLEKKTLDLKPEKKALAGHKKEVKESNVAVEEANARILNFFDKYSDAVNASKENIILNPGMVSLKGCVLAVDTSTKPSTLVVAHERTQSQVKRLKLPTFSTSGDELVISDRGDFGDLAELFLVWDGVVGYTDDKLDRDGYSIKGKKIILSKSGEILFNELTNSLRQYEDEDYVTETDLKHRELSKAKLGADKYNIAMTIITNRKNNKQFPLMNDKEAWEKAGFKFKTFGSDEELKALAQLESTYNTGKYVKSPNAGKSIKITPAESKKSDKDSKDDKPLLADRKIDDGKKQGVSASMSTEIGNGGRMSGSMSAGEKGTIDNANLSIESSMDPNSPSFKIDAWLLNRIIDGEKADPIIGTSLTIIRGNIGGYMSVQKGSVLEQYLISVGHKSEAGLFKITGAMFKDVVKLYFASVDKTVKVSPRETRLGVEWTKAFENKKALVRELGAGVSIYNVKSQNLGFLGNFQTEMGDIISSWDEHGAMKGGMTAHADAKVSLDPGSLLGIYNKTRLDIRATAEHIKEENALTKGKESTNFAGGAKLTVRPVDEIDVYLYGEYSKLSAKYGAGVKYSPEMQVKIGSYYFKPNLFAQAERFESFQSAVKSDSKVWGGFGATFGPIPESPKEKSKKPGLFSDPNDKLTFGDMQPDSRMSSINYNAPIKLDKKDILKWAVGKNVGQIDRLKNTLSIDSGVDNLQSIYKATLNGSPTSTAFFSIEGGKSLVVNLNMPIPAGLYRIGAKDSNGTYTVFELNVGMNNTIVTSSVIENEAILSDSEAFLAGTMTKTDIENKKLNQKADAFAFTAITNAELGQYYTSNEVTVSGIEYPVNVSIKGNDNGDISINGGSWVKSGKVKPGDKIKVRAMSSSNNSDAVSVSTIAGNNVKVESNFFVTTKERPASNGNGGDPEIVGSYPPTLNVPGSQNVLAGGTVTFSVTAAATHVGDTVSITSFSTNIGSIGHPGGSNYTFDASGLLALQTATVTFVATEKNSSNVVVGTTTKTVSISIN